MRTQILDHWLLVRLAAQNAYEILGPIGVARMGEVYHPGYQARSQCSQQSAAIAQNGAPLARFECETKVLEALNHPNIAQI